MSILSLLLTPLWWSLGLVESCMFLLMHGYDNYCYSPLQSALSPLVARIPRSVNFGRVKVTIFTANIVTWSRTAIVIPVAWCLKYGHPEAAFWWVLFHDFLDHLDGIVAKVQRRVYGPLDDPLLGGFLDAFCDKIVICLSLWSVLLMTDFSHMTTSQAAIFFTSCAVIISFEFIIGMVRVQDYYRALYTRNTNSQSTKETPNIASVMEGKLKEKLESVGVACICLAQGSMNPAHSTAGIVGVICLLLSVRLAYASLMHKLKPRRHNDEKKNEEITTTTATPTEMSASIDNYSVQLDTEQSLQKKHACIAIQTDSMLYSNLYNRVNSGDFSDNDQNDDDDDDNDDSETEKSDVSEKEEEFRRIDKVLSQTDSLSSLVPGVRVDKIYTVGCFDLFHEGHQKLLTRLHSMGKQVIVGVHDSRSIFKLKKRVPIDSTHRRMANVKKYADIVFCIRGSDPTPFLQSIFDEKEKVTSMYVRGDDMPNFPARDFMEKLMPVHFLPYTQSVSSTKIRKDVYNASKFGPHVQYDDHTMFY